MTSTALVVGCNYLSSGERVMGKNRELAESILARLELISNINRKAKNLDELWINSVEERLDEFEIQIKDGIKRDGE